MREQARERVISMMREGQARLIATFEALDAVGRFVGSSWERPGGGGGSARVLADGAVFEKAGINSSAVHGERTPPALWQAHPRTQGQPFFATGVSMVFHPVNPYVPAFHANFRYFESGGDSWFGGGMDMTPCYAFAEDAQYFHRTLDDYCAKHDVDYALLKKTCDEYFYIKHRKEMRGIGGIFFDEIDLGDFERTFAFVCDGIETIIKSYVPVARRRKDTPFGEREKNWQLIRRGRYAEFNLVYDRGTSFGLQTEGNIEAILMSLPPLVRWPFDYTPQGGSPEAATLEFLQPRDWI